nr:immunoglobulin light chain junction region [Macaca mulatta]MOW08994.1 immunoglobulin light chain junction region [Macaca mulatta]MOW09824.1 immunoglobulin light chain junction region [Macaca mulatta]MOW10732.1 immunoglobulin light chain junction region [Macaca mulatta]MOW11257.1 immunoglobulin light chain junction region [Macaca mulatta]
CQQHDTSPYSF